MGSKLYIYGAGSRGSFYMSKLLENKCMVSGFVDSYKSGFVEINKIKIPIFSIDIFEEKDRVIIAIADNYESKKVIERLNAYKVEIVGFEEELYQSTNSFVIERCKVIDAYANQETETTYYDYAESKEWMDTFWNEDSVFLRAFKELELTDMIELACGHGRHIPKYFNDAGRITLIDANRENIDFTRNRLNSLYSEDECKKVNYVTNNGYDLRELSDNTYTAIFCYDAMVHFTMWDIFSYLKETARVLKNGGRALYHHSNYDWDYKASFCDSPHNRNFMSKNLFAYMAYKVGLKIVSQQVIDWGDKDSKVDNLDCVSLLEKKYL